MTEKISLKCKSSVAAALAFASGREAAQNRTENAEPHQLLLIQSENQPEETLRGQGNDRCFSRQDGEKGGSQTT